MGKIYLCPRCEIRRVKKHKRRRLICKVCKAKGREKSKEKKKEYNRKYSAVYYLLVTKEKRKLEKELRKNVQ